MAYRKRKTEFAGVGALVQLLGIILLLVTALFPYSTIAGVLLFLIGSSLATKLICSDCGNKIEPSSLLCPTCKEPLIKSKIAKPSRPITVSNVVTDPQPQNSMKREHKFYVAVIVVIVVGVFFAAVLTNSGFISAASNTTEPELESLQGNVMPLSDDKNASQPTGLALRSEDASQERNSELLASLTNNKEAIPAPPSNTESSTTANALPARAFEPTESVQNEQPQGHVDAATKLRVRRIVSDYAHTRGETEIEFAQRLNSTPEDLEAWVYAYEKNGGTAERALQMRESFSKAMEDPEKRNLANCLANAFDQPRPAGQSPDLSECDTISRKIAETNR